MIKELVSEEWIAKYILWELFLLSELGYGLDLNKCAVSGKKNDLIYISPKSGKAVSKIEGEKYKNKLFYLPEFLINNNIKPSENSLKEGILVTGFFFEKFLKRNNKKLPFYRKSILT